VTHDDKIAKQCDRILKMEDGIIISDISEEE
jgi:predicted ABC-type transport system involved in lysophospholipase L1 biosynthesis ATPase subunit